MNPILMNLTVDAIVFLELSGDDVVDPDAAVKQLESIGWSLQQLSPQDRAIFIEFCRMRANECRRLDPDRAEFLERLPDELGLV